MANKKYETVSGVEDINIREIKRNKSATTHTKQNINARGTYIVVRHSSV